MFFVNLKSLRVILPKMKDVGTCNITRCGKTREFHFSTCRPVSEEKREVRLGHVTAYKPLLQLIHSKSLKHTLPTSTHMYHMFRNSKHLLYAVSHLPVLNIVTVIVSVTPAVVEETLCNTEDKIYLIDDNKND